MRALCCCQRQVAQCGDMRRHLAASTPMRRDQQQTLDLLLGLGAPASDTSPAEPGPPRSSCSVYSARDSRSPDSPLGGPRSTSDPSPDPGAHAPASGARSAGGPPACAVRCRLAGPAVQGMTGSRVAAVSMGSQAPHTQGCSSSASALRRWAGSTRRSSAIAACVHGPKHPEMSWQPG